jgi:hypothetical protein
MLAQAMQSGVAHLWKILIRNMKLLEALQVL